MYIASAILKVVPAITPNDMSSVEAPLVVEVVKAAPIGAVVDVPTRAAAVVVKDPV